MILAPVFSGESPSRNAKVIAEKTSASVARKIVIRLNCEWFLCQSRRLCDELQSLMPFRCIGIFGAAVGVETEVSPFLTNLKKLRVNADEIGAR